MGFHTTIDIIGGAILGLSIGALFGFYGFGIDLPTTIEFMFAVLFFVVPIGFSIGRIKAS